MRKPMDRAAKVIGTSLIVAAIIAMASTFPLALKGIATVQANEDPIGASFSWPEPYRSITLEQLAASKEPSELVDAWVARDDVRRFYDDGGGIRKSAILCKWSPTRDHSLDKGSLSHDQLIHVYRMGKDIWTIDFTEYTVECGWPVEPLRPGELDQYYIAKNFTFPKDGIGWSERGLKKKRDER